MSSISESGTGRGGLLASIGKLFGGSRKGDPPESVAEDEKAARPEATAKPLEHREMSEDPAPGKAENEEDELVLGPSLTPSPPEAEAEPGAPGEEILLGSEPAGEGAGEPAPMTGAAEPEEEDILARLRAVRAEQGDSEDAAEAQRAAPLEDAWTAIFDPDAAVSLQEAGTEADLSRASGGERDDGADKPLADDVEPEGRDLMEDADMGRDDETESTDDGRPAEADTASGRPASTVAFFPWQKPEEEAEEFAADAGDEPDDRRDPSGADEGEPETWQPESWESEATEPAGDAGAAHSEDQEAGSLEPEALEAEAAEPGEPGAAEPEAEGTDVEAAEAPQSLVEEANAEPLEAVDDVEAGAPEPEDEEAASPDPDEDEFRATEDEAETASAAANVVALGSATVSSAGDEMPEQAASDDAAGLSEAQVEAIVRRLIREELEGELGKRLSANIRRMVRDEVAHALLRHR